jgi:hypothetical protein
MTGEVLEEGPEQVCDEQQRAQPADLLVDPGFGPRDDQIEQFSDDPRVTRLRQVTAKIEKVATPRYFQYGRA